MRALDHICNMPRILGLQCLGFAPLIADGNIGNYKNMCFWVSVDVRSNVEWRGVPSPTHAVSRFQRQAFTSALTLR